MTNTLHRYGKAEGFSDDYIVFAMPSKGKNDEGAIEKLKTFLRICVRHNPSNIGASGQGSYRPSRTLNPGAKLNTPRSPLGADAPRLSLLLDLYLPYIGSSIGIGKAIWERE